MLKITEMFAFVVEDTDSHDEGIMSFRDLDGTQWPMVGADLERIEQLRPIADVIAKSFRREYKILRFKLEGEIP
jgi:hypothetical protein